MTETTVGRRSSCWRPKKVDVHLEERVRMICHQMDEKRGPRMRPPETLVHGTSTRRVLGWVWPGMATEGNCLSYEYVMPG